jgi:WD40 repeat protein
MTQAATPGPNFHYNAKGCPLSKEFCMKRRTLARYWMPILLIILPGIMPAAAQSGSLDAIRAYMIDAPQIYAEISPDGRTAALFVEGRLLDSDADRTPYLPIRLLDLTSGTVAEQVEQDGYTISIMQDEAVKLLTGPTDFPTDVVFTPDGGTLISFHQNGDIHTWDVASGEQRSYLRMPLLQFRDLTLMPDGEQLLSIGNNQPTNFALWNLDDFSIQRLFGFHFDTLTQLLEEASGMEARFAYQIVAYALSPDGTRILASNGNDGLVMFTLPDGEVTPILADGEQPGAMSITDLRFTADGSALYYADLTFDDRGPVIRRVDFAEGQPGEPTTLERGGAPFALSADNQRLAWVEEADGLSTFYLSTIDQAEILPVFATRARVQTRVRGLAFTPDGGQLVFSGAAVPGGPTALFVIPAA